MRRLALLLAVAVPTLALAQARPITVNDLWALQRVGAPTTSPDGQWCCVEVTAYDVAKNTASSDLWLLATNGSQQRQLTRAPGRSSGPKWSPDGRWIAFTSKRGADEHAQIYAISPLGGEAIRLSNLPAAASALKWGGDSRTVYCLVNTWPGCATDDDHKRKEKAEKDRPAKAVIIDDAQYRYWDHWLTDGKRPSVFAVDVGTNSHRNLLAASGKYLSAFEPSERDYDVSPDGRELCFAADTAKEPGRDRNEDLYTLDLTNPTAPAKNITADNAAADHHPAYSPDGSTIAYLRQSIKYFYADRTRLMTYDRAKGTSRELTAKLDRSCAAPTWLPDGKRIACEVEDAGFVKIGFFNASTGAVKLDDASASERSISFAKTQRLGVYLASSFDAPPAVYAHGPGGAAVRIDRFNETLTKTWSLGKVESRTIKGAGGRDVQMWVVYPPNFDAAKKWSLVQVVHGGPHSAITSDFSFRWNPQLWAAQGWVIGIVNFHGSSGFGQEFTDSITADLGTKPMDDIMKATDWFEAQPWIDKERIATAGASYGGYMMAWLNGHTDRFKAMVCHAGVYNWHSMMASDIVLGRNRSLGAFPWA